MERTAAGARRLRLLDLIRGLALIGILQMNLPAFLTFTEHNFTLLTAAAPVHDWLVWGFLDLFVAAKFYPIFAFLFGYGYVLQSDSLRRRGLLPRPVLLRRYGFLLGVGIVHGSLFFFGDILTMYAAAGILLVTTAAGATRTLSHQLRWWLVIALVVEAFSLWAAFSVGDAGVDHAEVLARIRFLSRASFAQFAPTRARYYRELQLDELITFLPQLMVLFLAGAWGARLGLLRRVKTYRAFWRKALLVGLFIGLPVNAVMLACDTALAFGHVGAVTLMLSDLGNFLACSLSIAWVAIVVLAAQRPKPAWPSRIGQAIARMGRMALTNYLLQSVIMLVALSGAGYGAAAWMSTTQLALFGLTISAAQLIGSDLWMRRFGIGPFEALWRRFTYHASVS